MSTARFERGLAPLYLISLLLLFSLAGPERAAAYDVCSDDITGDTSSCVHEQMAEYGAELYLGCLVGNNNCGAFIQNVANLRGGAGHEDQYDYVYGFTGSSVTISHFWDPDPSGTVFDPLNTTVLDGGAIFHGNVPNNWQKAQAYWSRALAEYAVGRRDTSRGAYHFLGHAVHHMGDNTIPTHAHLTSHGPLNRDSYENWMSNKYHDAVDSRVETGTSNHLLSDTEKQDLSAPYLPKVDRMDPLYYSNLDVDIPHVAELERPDIKLLWLMYTTNQIAEFFAGDRDDGESLDPKLWAQGDLVKMANAGLTPRTEAQMFLSNATDSNIDGQLGNIREYSYIRGIRAIAGLYNLFEQTVAQRAILTIEIHNANVVGGSNGNCNDGLIGDLCDFYSRVGFYNAAGTLMISGQNEGQEAEQRNGEYVFRDKNSISPTNWRWGHAVEMGGTANDDVYITLEIIDEDNTDADSPVRIVPTGANDNDGGKMLTLLVDLQGCLDGTAGAITAEAGTIGSNTCGERITTLVVGDEDENDGIAAVTFSVNVVEQLRPVVSCTPPDGTWHATNVDIACTASDGSGLSSGLAVPGDAAFSLTTIVPDGLERDDAQTTIRNVCDALNNCTRAGWAGAYNSYSGYRIDRRPPQLFVPADLTIEAAAELSMVSLGQPVARDFGSGVAGISNDADPAGFPVGTSIVTWSATDNVGNVTTGQQTVVVADTTAPEITVPSAVTVQAGVEGEDIGMATATDIVGVRHVSKDAPNMFPVGTTVVTWYAIDDARNVSQGTQEVTATKRGGGAFGGSGLLLLLLFGLMGRHLARRGTCYL